MKKLIKMKTLVKGGHHMFNYEDGKKQPIPNYVIVSAKGNKFYTCTR